MNAPGIVGHAGVFPFPGIERSSPDFAAASVFASDFSISASTELQKPHWRQLHCRQWSSDWASLHHWSHFAVCFVSSRHVTGSRSGSGCPPGSGALQKEHAAQSQLAQCCKLNLMEHQTVHLGTESGWSAWPQLAIVFCMRARVSPAAAHGVERLSGCGCGQVAVRSRERGERVGETARRPVRQPASYFPLPRPRDGWPVL